MSLNPINKHQHIQASPVPKSKHCLSSYDQLFNLQIQGFLAISQVSYPRNSESITACCLRQFIGRKLILSALFESIRLRFT